MCFCGAGEIRNFFANVGRTSGHSGLVTDSDGLSRWLNLGSYEVLAADFESAGEPWDEVFPAEFSEPVPDWLRAELPDTGWREVTARDRIEPSRARRLFAAPADDGAWMTALVWPQDGGLPVFMGDLGTHRLRPTQDIWRAGLTRPGESGDFICWEDEAHGTSIVVPEGAA